MSIELKLLFHKERLSHVQKCYLEKFQQISFSNDNDTWFLYQLYIPNKYNIYNDKYSRNDLVELVEAYIYGNVNQWLNEKGIDCSDEVNALFVFGHQCTGKSTLVSKIIYDHYFNNEMNIKPIYIVNFSDRSFKNNSLIPKDICEYLSIGIDCLANAILIIDGLDESEWSSAVASYKLERLINDLKAYECKLIVTSRPSYFCTVDLKNTLDIHLNPFSSEQATEWLKIYKQYESSCNIEDITQQIDSLLPDIRKVILIPYILYICVTNNILKASEITKGNNESVSRLTDICRALPIFEKYCSDAIKPRIDLLAAYQIPNDAHKEMPKRNIIITFHQEFNGLCNQVSYKGIPIHLQCHTLRSGRRNGPLSFSISC